MKKKYMLWILLVITILVFVAILWSSIVSNVEQAKYTVIESFGKIEIRDYLPMIIAEVDVKGDREDAANTGFRLLASYIFGDNKAQHSIEMTAPVIQKTSKIKMTAPVTQISTNDSWIIRFIMPASYSMESLPIPNNSRVKLIQIERKSFVVIRFSGLASNKNLQRHLQILLSFLKLKKLQADTQPTYAFFNPPWTFPPLRHNEIMIEIKR